MFSGTSSRNSTAASEDKVLRWKIGLIWLLISFVGGCQTAENTPSSSATSPTCEDQLANLSDFEGQITFLEKSKQAGGYVLSYGATAAGYTADAIVYVAEGVVKTVVYCPVYVVSVALGHIPMRYCDPKNPKDKVLGTRLGKNIYGNTEDMRKPDFTPLSRAIRDTSSCFESRGDPASLAKAKGQLVTLQRSDLFPHLSDQEKNEINSAIVRLSSNEKR
jgi:hypothetical protein